MKTVSATGSVLILVVGDWQSRADSFGSGANIFQIDFVMIGNPGNPADTTGAPNPAGSVDDVYLIGEYEVSEEMVDKANNAGGLGLTFSNRGANKPATYVSWYEAANFVNWLNTSTGSPPSYKFNTGGVFPLRSPGDPGYNANNLFRNNLARYFLPSADEWYKVAHYDPTQDVYDDYPTGSDNQPDGIDSLGDLAFDAVFSDGFFFTDPQDVDNVGLPSPYSTAGQGGNVWEWEETELDLVNDLTSLARGVRGGYWNSAFGFSLRATDRSFGNPALDYGVYGFRVASAILPVPEPSVSTFLFATAGLFFSHQATTECRGAIMKHAKPQGWQQQESSKRVTFRRRTPHRCQLGFEPLEDRRMLSTIVWTNRNTFSGASDNRFDDVFGALQSQAIAVIDADIAYWQRVIDDFNYDGDNNPATSNTYSLTISMNAAAQGSGAGSVGANATVTGSTGGKPSTANVAIGWRSGITPSGNSAAGWFLDPSPMDNSEFTTLTNAFTGTPPGGLNGGDLLTGVMHELGHAMGLSSNSTINAFATDTMVADTINTPASTPPSNYWRFDSPSVHTLWTGWDSGGAGPAPANFNGAQHFAPTGRRSHKPAEPTMEPSD